MGRPYRSMSVYPIPKYLQGFQLTLVLRSYTKFYTANLITIHIDST